MRVGTVPGSRPRVFVSSVVEGFKEFRQAAREGIEAAGGQPVLVNEQFPSLATSSRNACLDAVQSSDIYIAILGERGGWQAPSGLLVVEEEYGHARRHNIPTVIFIQDTTRDSDGERLVRQLSDYVDGRFRMQFRTTDELRSAIEHALRGPIDHLQKPSVNPHRILERLQHRSRDQNETALGFVLAPERAEEVIDPIRLEDEDFRYDLYEAVHHRSVRLMTHEAGKRYELGRDFVVVDQEGDRGRDRATPAVRLEAGTSGLLAIHSALTGRRPRNYRGGGLEGMMIARPDVEEVLRADFAFASALYEKLDPFRRHERFLYSVAISGIGHKRWVEEIQPTNSMTLGVGNHPDPLILLPEPRVISREALRQPLREIERIVTFARRELGR